MKLNIVKTRSLDLFAKLLATENVNIITVKGLRTPAFDTKGRTLLLPDWEVGNSEDVRELFRAHECAHALFTPTDGWHDAIKGNNEFKQLYKDCLNILEDARIEVSLKRRYPGFHSLFSRGYKDLYDQGFFGPKDSPSRLLADKINLKAKLQHNVEIEFTPEEQVVWNKVQLLQTWGDVVALADELYAWMKKDWKKKDEDKRKNKQKSKSKKGEKPEPTEGADSNESDAEVDTGDQETEEETGEGDSNAGQGDQDSDDEDAKSEAPGELDGNGNPADAGDEPGNSPGDGFEDQVSETEANYRDQVEELAKKNTLNGPEVPVVFNLFATSGDTLKAHLVPTEDIAKAMRTNTPAGFFKQTS